MRCRIESMDFPGAPQYQKLTKMYNFGEKKVSLILHLSYWIQKKPFLRWMKPVFQCQRNCNPVSQLEKHHLSVIIIQRWIWRINCFFDCFAGLNGHQSNSLQFAGKWLKINKVFCIISSSHRLLGLKMWISSYWESYWEAYWELYWES